jgi:hypothetical protein
LYKTIFINIQNGCRVQDEPTHFIFHCRPVVVFVISYPTEMSCWFLYNCTCLQEIYLIMAKFKMACFFEIFKAFILNKILDLCLLYIAQIIWKFILLQIYLWLINSKWRHILNFKTRFKAITIEFFLFFCGRVHFPYKISHQSSLRTNFFFTFFIFVIGNHCFGWNRKLFHFLHFSQTFTLEYITLPSCNIFERNTENLLYR